MNVTTTQRTLKLTNIKLVASQGSFEMIFENFEKNRHFYKNIIFVWKKKISTFGRNLLIFRRFFCMRKLHADVPPRAVRIVDKKIRFVLLMTIENDVKKVLFRNHRKRTILGSS